MAVKTTITQSGKEFGDISELFLGWIPLIMVLLSMLVLGGIGVYYTYFNSPTVKEDSASS